MYNKLFTKILDSSIWMESIETRIVWLTFIAAMDETGFVQFASVENVAHRARVGIEAASMAVKTLESPDFNSSDPENDGRRVERVPGGWIVLNAQKYRELVTRVVIQEQTRNRVRRFREKKRSGNGPVTPRNESVTPSKADTKAEAEAVERGVSVKASVPPLSTERPEKGKLLEDIECPACGRAGYLSQSTGRNGHPPGFWCRNTGGCGINYQIDYAPILEQMTPGAQAALAAMVPAKAQNRDEQNADTFAAVARKIEAGIPMILGRAK